MTFQPAAPALETLYRLLDLIRGRGKLAESLPAALAWLALGRLAERGCAPSFGSGSERDPQRLTLEADAPPVLREAMTKAFADWHGSMSSDATYIVQQLLDNPPKSGWGLQDAVWLASGKARNVADGLMGAFDPAVCDLAVAGLRLTDGDRVWVPFDPSGQFTTRLASKGVHVWRAGPGYENVTLTALLLALDDDPHVFDRVTFEFAPPQLDTVEEINKCLVAAPVGLKIASAHPWRQWQGEARGGRALWIEPGELDRSDAWAVASVWPLVRDRGVFLTSPSLLFAHGQEQRLRKALLLDRAGNMVEAVGALPQGSMGGASISPALLVLDATVRVDRVRLADLTGLETQDGTKIRREIGLDLLTAVGLLKPDHERSSLGVDVDLGEIERCDFSLLPQRYLKRVDDLSGERCALGSLVAQVVRSPVPTKDLNSWPVWEIGIPLLDQWRPILSGYERFMQITPRKADEALLREGDLVLSIKGTVGKAGIVGQIPASRDEALATEIEAARGGGTSEISEAPRSSAAVAAASCVALRVDRQKVLPEYLLLYLRSDDFKRQLEALRVGSTIAHITPAALLADVQVVLMSLDEQRQLCERYNSLCDMEEKVERLQRQIRETRDTLFPLSTAA